MIAATRHSTARGASRPWIRLARILDDLAEVLFHPTGTESLPRRVQTIAAGLRSFVAGNPDRALFLAHRHWLDKYVFYSVLHATRCAIGCDLIARRLGWAEENANSLVKAALTMNIAITELQAALALRPAGIDKPTPEQTEAIATHPVRGAAILRRAGVDDENWLQAVEQHHERIGGRGYPTGAPEPSLPARVLRCVDDFFAKTSARVSRPALPLWRAVRHLLADAADRPIVEALVKELGLYPPGTFVRLANGDLGIVLRRGRRIDTPLAVALANCTGERLTYPVRRDTGDMRYAIIMASNASGPTLTPRSKLTQRP